jgi:hypothetical protein
MRFLKYMLLVAALAISIPALAVETQIFDGRITAIKKVGSTKVESSDSASDSYEIHVHVEKYIKGNGAIDRLVFLPASIFSLNGFAPVGKFTDGFAISNPIVPGVGDYLEFTVREPTYAIRVKPTYVTESRIGEDGYREEVKSLNIAISTLDGEKEWDFPAYYVVAMRSYCGPNGKAAWVRSKWSTPGTCAFPIEDGFTRHEIYFAPGSSLVLGPNRDMKTIYGAWLGEGSRFRALKLPKGTKYVWNERSSNEAYFYFAQDAEFGELRLKGGVKFRREQTGVGNVEYEVTGHSPVLLTTNFHKADRWTDDTKSNEASQIRAFGNDAMCAAVSIPDEPGRDLTLQAAWWPQPVLLGGYYMQKGYASFWPNGQPRSYKPARDHVLNGVKVMSLGRVVFDRIGNAKYVLPRTLEMDTLGTVSFEDSASHCLPESFEAVGEEEQ